MEQVDKRCSVFIKIMRFMDLSDGFGIQKLRYSKWEWYCHMAIHNLAKQAKTRICPSLLKGPPTQILKHGCHTGPVITITCGPSCSPAFNLFKLTRVSSVWWEDMDYILQLWATKHAWGLLMSLEQTDS